MLCSPVVLGVLSLCDSREELLGFKILPLYPRCCSGWPLCPVPKEPAEHPEAPEALQGREDGVSGVLPSQGDALWRGDALTSA